METGKRALQKAHASCPVCNSSGKDPSSSTDAGGKSAAIGASEWPGEGEGGRGEGG